MFDAGYFVDIQGISQKIFRGEICAENAIITFLADTFKRKSIEDDQISISVDPVGDFSLYLNLKDGASFDKPMSFGKGQKIATFRRRNAVVGTGIGINMNGTNISVFGNNVFSAKLVSSSPFSIGRKTYDFKELLPNGMTQWGTASTQQYTVPKKYTSAAPFVGSAIAVG